MVFPMSASNMIDKAEGAGWGGKKPWVTESAASIGKAMEIKDKPVAVATVNTKGTKITNPTE